MKVTETLSMWRKILIAILSLLIIVCAILIGNIRHIIRYDSDFKDKYGYYLSEKWSKGQSHIGNISQFDSRGYKLDDNWVNIGNRYWYSNDLEDIDSNKEFGELIRLYSYSINDSSDPHYGETASLWIYDISKKCLELGMDREAFYKYMLKKCTHDSTSIWKSSIISRPFLALTTDPRIEVSIKEENPPLIYRENFIIFANNRVYCFNFANDKAKQISPKNDALFDKRCKSVIGDTDFMSYTQWEKDYYEYKELSEKEDYERELWSCILYGIVFTCCICIFVLNIRKIGKINKQARLLVFYVIVCLAIGLIVMAIGAFDSPCKNDTLGWLVFVFFPSFVICMQMITFLSKKSREAYNTYYLIPDVAKKYLNINTEYKKRLSLLLMFYPLFFIVPIPVIGLMVFVCYILPLAFLILIYLRTRKAIIWLKEGKKLDSKPNIQSEKARIYCRHCGKLIDADSDYCRYCGKKL